MAAVRRAASAVPQGGAQRPTLTAAGAAAGVAGGVPSPNPEARLRSSCARAAVRPGPARPNPAVRPDHLIRAAIDAGLAGDEPTSYRFWIAAAVWRALTRAGCAGGLVGVVFASVRGGSCSCWREGSWRSCCLLRRGVLWGSGGGE